MYFFITPRAILSLSLALRLTRFYLFAPLRARGGSKRRAGSQSLGAALFSHYQRGGVGGALTFLAACRLPCVEILERSLHIWLACLIAEGASAFSASMHSGVGSRRAAAARWHSQPVHVRKSEWRANRKCAMRKVWHCARRCQRLCYCSTRAKLTHAQSEHCVVIFLDWNNCETTLMINPCIVLGQSVSVDVKLYYCVLFCKTNNSLKLQSQSWMKSNTSHKLMLST